MRARVLVRPKAGILDPQGQAVERALPALGFTGVSNVHVGRLIELVSRTAGASFSPTGVLTLTGSGGAQMLAAARATLEELSQ